LSYKGSEVLPVQPMECLSLESFEDLSNVCAQDQETYGTQHREDS